LLIVGTPTAPVFLRHDLGSLLQHGIGSMTSPLMSAKQFKSPAPFVIIRIPRAFVNEGVDERPEDA
jgi:hypothetical protein